MKQKLILCKDQQNKTSSKTDRNSEGGQKTQIPASGIEQQILLQTPQTENKMENYKNAHINLITYKKQAASLKKHTLPQLNEYKIENLINPVTK